MVETQASAVGAASHIIKRPRLTKILDETEARIILLCAPAGYGKTTLAREWVATRTEPVLWYSGGPAMADVAALAADLAELLGGDLATLERVRSLAGHGGRAAAIARAVNPTRVDAATILVLDDVHFAAEATDADALLGELVSRTPCRFLIASRIRPKWISSRRSVYGEAAVLTSAELAFTVAEAEAVTPRSAELLGSARGWPAVIGLAAVSGEITSPAKGLNPAELYDFFAAELLGAVEAERHRQLYQLAAGGDTSAAVARELFDDRLDELLRWTIDRGFLTREPDRWVAMHPLLRQFLLRAASELQPAIAAEIVTPVLTALRHHREWDACLELMHAFPDAESAESVLSTAIQDLSDQGRMTTLERWVTWASEVGVNAPVFRLARAEVALRQGHYVAARALAEEAASALAGDLAAAAYLAAGRATHHLDDHSAGESARRAAAHAESPALRAEALWLEFADAYERDPSAISKTFAQLVALNDSRPEHSLRVACATVFTEIGLRGNLGIALAAAERAAAIAQSVSDPYLRTNALYVLAQLERALAHYTRALETCRVLRSEAEEAGLDFVIDHVLLVEAAAHTGLRSMKAARGIVRELERRSDSASHHIRGNTTMLKARLRIASGDLDGAAAYMDDAPPQLPAALRGEHFALRALVAAARGDQHGARHAIQAAETTAAHLEGERTRRLAMTISSIKGSHSSTGARETVALALEEGCADVLVHAFRSCPELARLSAVADLEPALRDLLSRSNDMDIARVAGISIPREVRRSQGLSDREREVLDLIVMGRTNAEIARTPSSLASRLPRSMCGTFWRSSACIAGQKRRRQHANFSRPRRRPPRIWRKKQRPR